MARATTLLVGCPGEEELERGGTLMDTAQCYHSSGDLLLVPDQGSFRARPCEWTAVDVPQPKALGFGGKALLRAALFAARYSLVLVPVARAFRAAPG